MKNLNKRFDKPAACAGWLVLIFCFQLTDAQSLDGQEWEAPIKVMSFNVRYGTANDGDNHWKHRFLIVHETIEVFDPDLLGVQEALGFQCDYLREKFPEYGFVGRGRDVIADQGEYSAILFRRQRFKPLESGHFWLSETPAVPGSRSWDSSLPRMVTWVRLEDKRSGKQLVFANTHFDHRGPEARTRSVTVIREQLLDKPDFAETPFVLSGDFNTAVGSEPYRQLVETESSGHRKLADSLRVIHPGSRQNEGTFGGWAGKRDGARIDWILHSSDFDTVNAAINYHNWQGRYPSDHYPVQAIIRMKK